MILQCYSSLQDGNYALRKVHMCSTPSLRSFPNVAFKTVHVIVLQPYCGTVLTPTRSEHDETQNNTWFYNATVELSLLQQGQSMKKLNTID